jgi:hypothetical protein
MKSLMLAAVLFACAAFIFGLVSGLLAVLKSRKGPQPLPIGTKTPWGQIVKCAPAYWCVPEGQTEAVIISAELVESEILFEAKQ